MYHIQLYKSSQKTVKFRLTKFSFKASKKKSGFHSKATKILIWILKWFTTIFCWTTIFLKREFFHSKCIKFPSSYIIISRENSLLLACVLKFTNTVDIATVTISVSDSPMVINFSAQLCCEFWWIKIETFTSIPTLNCMFIHFYNNNNMKHTPTSCLAMWCSTRTASINFIKFHARIMESFSVFFLSSSCNEIRGVLT